MVIVSFALVARALRATKAELSTLLSFFATAGLSASIPSTLQPYKYIAKWREIQYSRTAQINCVALSTLSPRQAAFSRCPFSDDYRGNFYHSYFSPPPSLAPCLSLFSSAGWKMSFSHGHPQAGCLMRHISLVFTPLATQTIPRYNHSV